MVNRKRKIEMVQSREKNEPGKVSCKIPGMEATRDETSRTPKKVGKRKESTEP